MRYRGSSDDDKAESHLLERFTVATEKKKVMYGMEIKALLYFCVRGK
jgi:hypothetical protein